jgi:hypothetical protein
MTSPRNIGGPRRRSNLLHPGRRPVDSGRIFLCIPKKDADEHFFYELLPNNTLELISTFDAENPPDYVYPQLQFEGQAFGIEGDSFWPYLTFKSWNGVQYGMYGGGLFPDPTFPGDTEGALVSLWRSVDNCLTWQELDVTQIDSSAGGQGSPSGPIAFPLTTAFGMDAGGRLWILFEPARNYTGQYVAYSDDGGDTWEMNDPGWLIMTDTPGGFDYPSPGSERKYSAFDVAPHPTDENVIVLNTNHEVWAALEIVYTKDRGETWDVFPLHPEGPPGLYPTSSFWGWEVKSGLFLPSGRYIVCSESYNRPDPITSFDIVVLYSDDPTGGQGTFTYVKVHGPATQGTDYANPPLSMSYDGGKLFIFFSETHEGGPAPGNIADSAHIYQSLDEGATWTPVTLWPTQLWWEDIASGFYDARYDRLVVITTGAFTPQPGYVRESKVWVSSPPGQNWKDITPQLGLSWVGAMTIWRSTAQSKRQFRRITNRVGPF